MPLRDFSLQNDDIIGYFYSGVFGGVFGLIISICILTQISFNYIRTFHYKHKYDEAKPSKRIHIFFMITLILCLFLSINYVFIKSNYFTKISKNQFTSTLCYIGYYGQAILLQFHQFFMYLLFIYRLQVAFENTIYQYNHRIFTLLYIMLIMSFIPFTISVTLHHKNLSFDIYYFQKHPNFLWCGSAEGTAQTPLIFIASISYILWQVMFNIICLYMFTKRLSALKLRRIERFVVENSSVKPLPNTELSSPQISSTSSKPERTMSTLSEITIETEGGDDNTEEITNATKSVSASSTLPPRLPPPLKLKKSASVSINDIKKEKRKGDISAKEIIKLHALIKKHTILVFIAIFTCIFWLLSTFIISGWMWLQIPWVTVIVDLCIWLMFASMEKVWRCIAKCCCYVCRVQYVQKSVVNKI